VLAVLLRSSDVPWDDIGYTTYMQISTKICGVAFVGDQESTEASSRDTENWE
jgi:hypothetical protein